MMCLVSCHIGLVLVLGSDEVVDCHISCSPSTWMCWLTDLKCSCLGVV